MNLDVTLAGTQLWNCIVRPRDLDNTTLDKASRAAGLAKRHPLVMPTCEFPSKSPGVLRMLFPRRLFSLPRGAFVVFRHGSKRRGYIGDRLERAERLGHEAQPQKPGGPWLGTPVSLSKLLYSFRLGFEHGFGTCVKCWAKFEGGCFFFGQALGCKQARHRATCAIQN